MMATYWKSPYKESSQLGRHDPTTSTGRFEQSLSLSRAKTSILASGHDVFGWNLPSPRRPGSSQHHQTSLNGNLKGILKTPKVTLSPRLRGRIDVNDKDDTSDEKPTSSRPLKRVSFGPCDDTFDDESEASATNARGFRAHFVTIQRLNHSRKVEESAMQKLNKLISGSPSKSTNSSISDKKISSTKTSPLPVVDGKGLLTPRKELTEKPLSSCKHSPDLKCADCMNKDVETGEVEIKSTCTNPLQRDDCDNSNTDLHNERAESETINEQTTRNEAIDSKYEDSIPVKAMEEMDLHVSRERSTVRRRTSQHKPKPVSFQGKRFQSKLLPGRYPFNTSIIYMRNASQKAHGSDKEKPRPETSDKTRVPPLTDEQTDAGVHAEALPKNGHKQVSPDSTRSQSTECSDCNKGHIPIIRSKSDTRDRRYMDKTTQILTWLKDVRQKQNFKPRKSRFLVIESQSLQ